MNICFKQKAFAAIIVLTILLGASTAYYNDNKGHIITTKPQADLAFKVLIGNESNGKQLGGPNSVAGANEPTTSHKGAIGIAQVMPRTAKDVAKRHNIKWSKKRYRNDANYNRMIGRIYFNEQLKHFNGDLRKALAAYNGGPTRTRKMIRLATNNGEANNWLTYMPRETRHYVKANMLKFSKERKRMSMLKLSISNYSGS